MLSTWCPLFVCKILKLARVELRCGQPQPRFQVLSEWPPSCSSRYRWRTTQTIDQDKDALEDSARQASIGHLEDGVARMFDQSSAGLDQAFPERGQRPGFDRLRRRDGAQEVGEIVSQGMKLEPYSIGREAHAGQPRPLQRVLAFLDVLLRRSPVIIEGQDPFVG